MPSVRTTEVPPHSLLGQYAASGAFTDCYIADLPFPVTHAQFVEAFYTTGLFRIERLLLRLVSHPSTDAQVRMLASGQSDAFAAWSVEARAENQILLAAGRTRSWLMVVPHPATDPNGVQLFFGSAVVPRQNPASGSRSMGPLFGALLGFHKLYSRALLAAARARLAKEHRNEA